MKNGLKILTVIGITLFDITLVTTAFCWMFGVVDLDGARGLSLFFMWIFGIFVTGIPLNCVSGKHNKD